DVREFDRGMTVFQYGTKTWEEAERAADKKARIREGTPEDGERSGVGGSPSSETTVGESPSVDGEGRGSKIPLVRSGLVKKRDILSRAPAILDVPVGEGRIVFMSFNPLHRHQNQHDFALVGNVFAFWNDLPAPLPKAETRRR
ncbi:MAG: hypothetical protein ACPHRO_09270, partial [Nannocystaceae bacterium]